MRIVDFVINNLSTSLNPSLPLVWTRVVEDTFEM